MATRTKWDIIKERKLAKKVDRALDGPFRPDLVWRKCKLCKRPYAANNYQDGKTRVYRWRGIEVCAHCRYNCLKYLPRLQKLGAIKIKGVK